MSSGSACAAFALAPNRDRSTADYSADLAEKTILSNPMNLSQQ